MKQVGEEKNYRAVILNISRKVISKMSQSEFLKASNSYFIPITEQSYDCAGPVQHNLTPFTLSSE